MCIKCCLLAAFTSIGVIAQVSTDTLKVGALSVRASLEAEALVLSNFIKANDPFYHASTMLHAVPSVTINDIVSIRLRTIAENWNWSNSYDASENKIFWAKPSIRFNIPVTHVADSITVLVGDLWRIKSGQGLALDYFEAQGMQGEVHAGKFYFKAAVAGYGWTGQDDIYIGRAQYDSVFGLNVFVNTLTHIAELDLSGTDRAVLSADVDITLGNGFRVYAEVGTTLVHSAAAMAGIKYNFDSDNTTIDVKIEGRYYRGKFFDGAPTYGPYGFTDPSYPYINSMTSLDKPINTYRSWVDRERGAYIRIKARQIIYGGLFISTDTEYITDGEGVYTESGIGYRVMKDADLQIVYLNKLFTLYDSGFGVHAPMFRLSSQPSLKFTARL